MKRDEMIGDAGFRAVTGAQSAPFIEQPPEVRGYHIAHGRAAAAEARMIDTCLSCRKCYRCRIQFIVAVIIGTTKIRKFGCNRHEPKEGE